MKNEILFERTKDKQELIKQFEKVLNQYKKIAVFRLKNGSFTPLSTNTLRTLDVFGKKYSAHC